jgi:hypothetical protein
MIPTSMVVPQNQMAASKISKSQSKAAAMVAEITKTHARKNKVPNNPQAKQPVLQNNTQQVATQISLIHCLCTIERFV